MFFPRVAGLFGSALFLISSTAGHAGATEIKVDPFVEKQRGFLRDVATAADGNGLLVSDAVAPAESYVQLSDEEILADNPDLARFFEMIEDDEKYAKWEKEEMPQIVSNESVSMFTLIVDSIQFGSTLRFPPSTNHFFIASRDQSEPQFR
jgi:hypothetical protein